MIKLEEIAKKFGLRTLFEEVNITFSSGHRYALTGPNGAGKSSLLKIIMKQEEPTSGKVIHPKKVGFLNQDIEPFQEFNIVDIVIMGNARLYKAMHERDKLYEQEMDDEIGMKIAELEEIVGLEDGYTAESDAELLLAGIGIDSSFFTKKLKTLPSDQQFRVLLCQALFGNPEALLLDEPTNHLDLDSIHWLEEFLHAYTGVLIVVSHDRHFLNSIATDIADIDYENIIIYPGNYDSMVAAKSQVRARAEEQNKSRGKKVAQLKEFVAKFSAGTRASQVQSRLKEIEKLAPNDLKKSNIQRPFIKYLEPEQKPGQVIYKVKKISKAFNFPVINKFSIEIMRGEKIAIIGNNGIGKTTLLKLLASKIKPDSGLIEQGHNMDIGYFPQNHSEILDDKSSTPMFDWLRAQNTKHTDQEIRSALGKLLFSGDDVFKEINKLSGGEKARLILSNLTLHATNTMIFDEPNNHLDLESVSALATSIKNFPGTVLVATHDRTLIESFATRIISITSGSIEVFDGNYHEFLKSHDKAVK